MSRKPSVDQRLPAHCLFMIKAKFLPPVPGCRQKKQRGQCIHKGRRKSEIVRDRIVLIHVIDLCISPHSAGETVLAEFLKKSSAFAQDRQCVLQHVTGQYVEENFSDNATALFGTKGVQLVMDGAKVTGVIAQDSDGNYLKINAKNGVVLAGGGFGGNKEMMDDLLPDIKRLFTKDEDFFAPFGRDGSTIQMGVWAGGRLEGDISTMNFDSMAVPDYLPGPLWVDENGQRFQNEAFAGPEINGFFMARAKRGNITSIYDSTYETQILRGFPGHQAFEYDMPAVVEAMKGNFEAAKAAGAEGANGWYCADTIEQLAEYIGVEPAALSATVEQYNKVCAEGYDSDFAKDPHFLNAVAKAPFYAHVTTPSLGFALVTTGGFVTTNDQQVLNEDYQPIEGLYASGNTCGMRFGPEYITPIPGVSIGMCLTLGRELGKYLAAK